MPSPRNHDVRLPTVLRATVLLATVLLATVPAGVSAKDAARLPADEAKRHIEELATAALEKGAVGLSVAVAYDGEVIFDQGFGLAEVEHDVAVDKNTMFRIGSITKQFTAALIMQQVEAEKIGLDDPISKYTDFPTGEHVVTVRHLLTHTSGIKSYTGLGPGWQKTVPLEMANDELLGLVKDLPFDFAPGEEYRYNNSGYFLLGVILEKVTGKTLAELLQTQIAAPLRLERTRYGSNADIIKNRAQGYRLEDKELKNDKLIGMSQPGAAGAMLSSAGDLLRWQHALSTGEVVASESYAKMITPHVLNNGEATTYGFGLGITEADGLPLVQHGGGINGFSSMLAHSPETGVTLAVISNSEAFNAGPLAKEINRAVHGIEIVVADLAVSKAERQRLMGDYAFEDLPIELAVTAKGEHLFVQATGQGLDRILRQEDGTYRAGFDNDVRLEFDEGDPAAGLTLYQGGGEFAATRKE